MHVYLDYNASAPLRPEARQAWLHCQDEIAGNPNSTHHYGQRSRALFDQSRTQLADALGCKGHELVLCGSGSEANALAIHAALAIGAETLNSPRAHIRCSAIEHSSVLRNAETHVRTVRIPVDQDGLLDKTALLADLDEHCVLVCFQFANNELGCIQAVEDLVAAIKQRSPQTLVLLDACQGAGKYPLALRALGVDFASVAGHKFGAPKGCGLLYGKLGLKIEALINGGRQQQDRRSGTEDVAAIAAMAAAMQASTATYQADSARQAALLDETWSQIQAALPAAVWLAQDAPRLPNTMSIAHAGVKNSALIPRLDLSGYCVSPGSACMAARGEPSHVIAALGVEKSLAQSVIRVSIGAATTAEEMQGFAAAYIAEVQSLLGS